MPYRQTRALLIIFLMTAFLGLLCIFFLQPLLKLHGFPIPDTMFSYLHILMFVLSLVPAYIITYSALEVDSPTLVIVKKIADAGKHGLTLNELGQLINDDHLIFPRIRDLIRDGYIIDDSQQYWITSKGKHFISIFIFYRSLLNLPAGG
ncbi:MAG: hypothetical protein HQK77_16325 [Desulfobacterales bacterium]|nr:hypothetical protein [Desulfobacterales bacterium]